MSTLTATETTTETFPCPRCAGFARAFTAYGHVNGGRCFLCNGSLVATDSQVARYLAARDRGGYADPEVAAAYDARMAARFSARKLVTLPTLGEVTIARWADGSGFALVTKSADAGELLSTFGVRDGRVFLTAACAGHLGEFIRGAWYLGDEMTEGRAKRALRDELQAALRK